MWELEHSRMQKDTYQDIYSQGSYPQCCSSTARGRERNKGADAGVFKHLRKESYYMLGDTERLKQS